MWKAVRNGDPGGYAYLAWMHHNGHIGGHLEPHLQPRLPDGGGESDDRAANKKPGWKPGARSEAELRRTASAYWGEDRLARSNDGRGADVAPKGGGGGSSSRRRRGGGGDGVEGHDDDDHDDYFWGEEEEEDGGGGGEWTEREFEERDGPGVLMTGEDVWGGMPSDESWNWETIGGGVSGAIAAADLYLEGFLVSWLSRRGGERDFLCVFHRPCC